MKRRNAAIALALVVLLILMAGATVYLLSQTPAPADGLVPAVGLDFHPDSVNESVEVVSVSPQGWGLARFGAIATRENATVGQLSRLSDGATSAALTFFDEDADGRLSVGDVLSLTPQWAGWRSVNVTYGGNAVGHYAWYLSPLLALAPAVVTFANVTVDVLNVANTDALGQFSAVLRRGGLVIGELPTLAGASVSLTFLDQDLDGALSRGDRFETDVVDPGSYELTVSWRGSLVVASRSWTVGPPKPAVSFSPPAIGPSSVQVVVASVSSAESLSLFRGVLERSSTVIGDLNPLSSGGSDGNLSFLDLNGDGRLTAGDRFVVDTLQPGSYQITLYWTDGTIVAAVGWTI